MAIEQAHNNEFSYESPDKLTEKEAREEIVFPQTMKEIEQKDENTYKVISEEEWEQKEYIRNNDVTYKAPSVFVKKEKLSEINDMIKEYLLSINPSIFAKNKYEPGKEPARLKGMMKAFDGYQKDIKSGKISINLGLNAAANIPNFRITKQSGTSITTGNEIGMYKNGNKVEPAISILLNENQDIGTYIKIGDEETHFFDPTGVNLLKALSEKSEENNTNA